MLIDLIFLIYLFFFLSLISLTMGIMKKASKTGGRGAPAVIYLVSSPSMDDGLDEDTQVLPGLSGLVPLKADSKAR